MTARPVFATTMNTTPFDAIADFLERYCHTLDDGSVDDWSAYFEQDGVYRVTTRENVEANRPIGIVLCEGRGMMDDRIKALKIANIFESHTFRHMVGRPIVEPEFEGRFTVRSSFSVFRIMYTGKTDLFATGRYEDVVSVSESGILFAERSVVLDSRLLDTLMVYPL
ncbi:aromatic-ring-hydroxylating dioxygenase subunit beta [Hydrogenophaga sp.]|jgi:anthranilate 1,2-dioxygenase small subunit|uniref:aromatic-ring-hydroxylating dioxygenase subunit beta n=1 Tax=Hydrogenophaga sp. TaxID=1904254 RepID=UPI003F6EDACA